MDDGHLHVTIEGGNTLDTGITQFKVAQVYAQEAKDSLGKTLASEQRTVTSEQNAKVSETNAKTSEGNSLEYSKNASESRENALESEHKASASEANAKASETASRQSEENALSYEGLSRKWAMDEESPDDVADGESKTGKTQSSRSWALDAKSHEESAKGFAENASTRANASKVSADNSEKSAQNAKVSESNAKDSENASLSSQKAAALSESNASKSATAASSSEFNALSYKGSASLSEQNASDYASNASKSETNARSFMNSASKSATAAGTSESNAKTSETNAAASELAAKQALEQAVSAKDSAEEALNKITGVFKLCGQVETYADLPIEQNNKGDVWNIVEVDKEHGIKAGDNVVWNGMDWDNLSGFVDLSNYYTKGDLGSSFTSATANGNVITFTQKNGETVAITIGSATKADSATKDGKGNIIDSTYETLADASTVHASMQKSINSLSTGKQDKLVFDTTPTADSTNPVTSGGVFAAIPTKISQLDGYSDADATLDKKSTHPVQNKPVAEAIGKINSNFITIGHGDAPVTTMALMSYKLDEYVGSMYETEKDSVCIWLWFKDKAECQGWVTLKDFLSAEHITDYDFLRNKPILAISSSYAPKYTDAANQIKSTNSVADNLTTLDKKIDETRDIISTAHSTDIANLQSSIDEIQEATDAEIDAIFEESEV